METSCHIQSLLLCSSKNIACLVYIGRHHYKCAIFNVLAFISDIIFGEVTGGPCFLTSCPTSFNNICNEMGFHLGLNASEFYYVTFPYGFSWFLFWTLFNTKSLALVAH